MPDRLVFGEVWPDEVPAGPPMAYAGRAACGHIRWVVRDTKPGAEDEALKMGVAGLLVERIPWDRAEAERGSCWQCNPEQRGLGL